MDEWLAEMVHAFQDSPLPMERVQRAAIVVKASNDRVAQAGLAMSAMEDNPGAFDTWCRGFAMSTKNSD